MNTLSQNYFRKIETFEESFKAASQQLEIELISKLHAGLLDDLLPETKVGPQKSATIMNQRVICNSTCTYDNGVSILISTDTVLTQ